MGIIICCENKSNLCKNQLMKVENECEEKENKMNHNNTLKLNNGVLKPQTTIMKHNSIKQQNVLFNRNRRRIYFRKQRTIKRIYYSLATTSNVFIIFLFQLNRCDNSNIIRRMHVRTNSRIHEYRHFSFRSKIIKRNRRRKILRKKNIINRK